MTETVKTIDVGGRELTLKTGWMGKQANGAVYVQYGETVVFVAATASDSPREGIDFFPLTVDYREKTYSAGKIPGGFFKREARPSEKEVLTCRLIDRPIRPCFPDGFRNELQVQAMVWSHDLEHDPDVLAIVGAAAALAVSDIPFNKTLGAVRVGRVEGELIANPTYDELGEGDLDVVLVGTRDAIVMVEGSALEITEEDMLEALEFGHREMQPIIDAIEELVKEVGKPKQAFSAPPDLGDLKDRVASLVADKIKAAYSGEYHKEELYGAIDAARAEVIAELCPEGQEDAPAPGVVKGLFKSVESDTLRAAVLEENRRPDGRASTEIRPIDVQVATLPRTHGSALFTRGETQALVTATLGTGSDEQIMDVLEGEYKKKFYLHYNFPPFSVGETRRIMGPSRRDIGHGMLAERALRAVLPALEEFPYTLRVVSEILESNGSSSMATVCGGSLALMDAGVPIIAPVAGIAMGLIADGDRTAILSDILGVEDHLGDMDFKIAGTEEGITAFQMDLKIEGVSSDLMAQALQQARDGRLHILEAMAEALAEPRPKLSQYAPKITQLVISRERIRDLIGPGGKTIRGICEMTGAQIDVEDDGTVTIAAFDEEVATQAVEMVRSITEDPEVGKKYPGRVTRLMRFGAFVEILPGKEGMVHISDMSSGRIDRVEDVCNIGDEIEVIVKEVDPQGRVNLFLAALPTGGGNGGGDRDDRGGGRGRGRDGRGGRESRGGMGRDGGRGRDRGRGDRDDRGRDRGDRGGRGRGRDRDRPRGDRDDRGGRGGGRGDRDRDDRGGRDRGRERDDRGPREPRGDRDRDDRGGRDRGRDRDDRGPRESQGDRVREAEPTEARGLDWYDRGSRWERDARTGARRSESDD